MLMKYKDFKMLSKDDMKNVLGGNVVMYDCVFSYSNGQTEHVFRSGESGGQVQCQADLDCWNMGSSCTGVDCKGSGAC
jgi:hypothetical protein